MSEDLFSACGECKHLHCGNHEDAYEIFHYTCGSNSYAKSAAGDFDTDFEF